MKIRQVVSMSKRNVRIDHRPLVITGVTGKMTTSLIRRIKRRVDRRNDEIAPKHGRRRIKIPKPKLLKHLASLIDLCQTQRTRRTRRSSNL